VNRETVCAHLLRLIDELEQSEGKNPRTLFRAALCIEHVVMSDLWSPEEEDAIFGDPRIISRAGVSQRIFCDLESSIERSMADFVRLGGAETTWDPKDVSQHYIARYEYLAQCEVELSRMQRDDKVLFIGSGYLPITAFEYVRQAGCHVDCVDFVPEAIECARGITRRIDMEDRVRFFQTRGEAHDPGEYDVILVGVLAMPKMAILGHLAAHVKGGCRVLCRTTYGLRQLVYQKAAIEYAAVPRLEPGPRSVARGERVISAELLVAR
jgi:hypothetical protein